MDEKRNAPPSDDLVVRVNSTVDRDARAGALRQVFEDVVVHDHGELAGFYYEHSFVAFEDVRLARIASSGGSFTATNNDSFHLGFVVSGGAETNARGVPVQARPFCNANLVRGRDRFTIEVAPHTVSQIIEIDNAALLARARDFSGRDLDVASLARNVSLIEPAGAALIRTSVGTLSELKLLASAGLSRLAVASYSELLINLVLATIIPDEGAGADPSSPRVADRAREYILAHAHEPLKIAELARILDVSLRSLQMGFKAHFGCSPLQFLIQCRLDNARVRLQSGHTGETVTSIAWESGFIQPSVFAARYRARFGELPSETLRRNRR